jgi:acetyl esterase/lipase
MARMAAMPPLTAETVPMMRAGMAGAAPTDEVLSRGGAFRIEEVSVPGPEGAPVITVLVCRPAVATGRTAAVYYIHGGRYVLGDSRTELPSLLDVALELGLSVISVSYRLAPETPPNPGRVEDCYAGLLWSAANADDLEIDARRLVIAGAVRVVGSRPLSPSWCATAVDQPWPGNC